MRSSWKQELAACGVNPSCHQQKDTIVPCYETVGGYRAWRSTCIDWQGEEPVCATATADELGTKQTGDENDVHRQIAGAAMNESQWGEGGKFK